MPVVNIVLPPGYEEGTFSPAFDPTNTNPSNTVPQELHEMSAAFGSEQQFLIPAFAPYFEEGAIVEIKYFGEATYKPAIKGIDYLPSLPHLSASKAARKAVFAGISLLKTTVPAVVRITYPPLGGKWTLGKSSAFKLAVELKDNVFEQTLEQVVGYQERFPAVDSPWDKPDPTGVSELVDAVRRYGQSLAAAAIRSTQDAAIAQRHITAPIDEHEPNVTQIGLEKVVNYPGATDAQAEDKDVDNAYVNIGQLPAVLRGAFGQATPDRAGVLQLNLGQQTGDDTNAVDGLTVDGFMNLVGQRGGAVAKAFNTSQQEVQIKPWPTAFPAVWQGVSYASVKDVAAAAAAAVGLNQIEANSVTGKLYFPSDVRVPTVQLG